MADTEAEKKAKQIVVLLIGPPGSGKSTFCDTVMQSPHRPWSRICQDIINNGKAGTKAQCLKMAIGSLKGGKSVFIDRCNLDKEQRSEFIKLGGPEVEVHAVVLEHPAQVCISRSVKRTGHEGNLQGGRAAAVVNKMLQSKELPKVSEGFSRVMFCYNDADVETAVKTYSMLGPMDTLPSGCFGQKNSDTKSQPGIMKFFKKVSALPGSSSSNGATEATRKANEKTENVRVSPVKLGSADIVPTLAFPSISTADFQFDLEMASDIIVETAEEFLPKLGSARLVLVDLGHGSKILSLVKAKASRKNIDSGRFFTFVGDITKLRSEGGLHCNVIANAANWRLKPGGGGVNAAIFKAAGQDLEAATRARANTLIPGKAVVVHLPSTCPLQNAEGVTHVIHVLGPNMNPNRPNYLNNDYTKGCKTLREAYTSLFEGFLSIVQDQSKLPKRSNQATMSDSGENIKEESERNKRCKGAQEKATANNSLEFGSVDEIKDSGKKMGKGWSSWALALHTIAMHPEKHENVVLEFSDHIVVINDQYPKARKHVLVLARQESVDGLEDVRRENLQLLQEMHNVGLRWVKKFQDEDASLIFRLGYHSVPSMRQLHLHVISQDFESDNLKNKKHWNSFTSSFFRDSVDVLEEVKSQGKANVESEQVLKGELRCNRCRSARLLQLLVNLNKLWSKLCTSCVRGHGEEKTNGFPFKLRYRNLASVSRNHKVTRRSHQDGFQSLFSPSSVFFLFNLLHSLWRERVSISSIASNDADTILIHKFTMIINNHQVWDSPNLEKLIQAVTGFRISKRDSEPRHLSEVVSKGLFLLIARHKDDLKSRFCREFVVHFHKLWSESLTWSAPRS